MATGGQLSRSVVGASDEYFEFTCSPCKQESKFMEAEVFCEDCSEYLCRQCLKFHNKFKKMKAHRMVDKDGMKAQGHRKPLSAPTETCEKHHGRLLDTYCRDHDAMCCVTCVSLNHITCKGRVYLADAAEGISSSKAKKTFNDALGELKDKLTRLEKEKRDALEESDKDTTRAKDKILKTHQLIIEHLSKLVETSLAEIDERDSERKSVIQNDVKMVTDMISEIQDIGDNIDPSKEKNETKVFVNLKRNEEKLSSFNDDLNQLQNSTTDKWEFVVTQQILDITEHVTSFGQLEHVSCSSCPNDVTCSVMLNNQTCEVIKPGNKHNVKLQDEKPCSITSMCQMKDGTIILSDCKNKTLKRLDTSYRVRDYLQMPGSPSQVCCSGMNELVVALLIEKEICFVSVTDTLRLTSRKFSVGDWYCGGVACLGDTLFVSCDKFGKTDCLKLFNKSGDVLKTVVNDSNGQPLFPNITRLLVSEYDGCVYIADRKTGVIRLDREGKPLATSDTLREAVNVCDYGKDAILVCDFDNNRLVKLDRNRTSSTTLLGRNDGIINPQSACVNRKASKLLVGMAGNANILVFDLV